MARGDTRCVEGRIMRHDPFFDDPDLETDVGACPDLHRGKCDRCGELEAEERIQHG